MSNVLPNKINEEILDEDVSMTPRETKLKKKILDMLRDDGRGHHHAKYADRFEDYFVNIVDLDTDPDFTAAINFDEGIIYVGEGFIADPTLFYQMNVLMRHELAHALLMHSTRMMRVFKKKFGDKIAEHFRFDSSIHTLLNIIEDFEISNRVYTDDDLLIIRGMRNIIKTVCGLVTQDIRPDWKTMSLERMYDALSEEMEANDNLVKDLQDEEELMWIQDKDEDFINRNIKSLYSYKIPYDYTTINMPLDQFIDESETFPQMPKTLQDLAVAFNDLYKNFDKKNKSEADKLRSEIALIRKSRPLDTVKLNNGIEVYTPTEKWFAIDIMKNILGEVDENKYVIKVKKSEKSDEYVELFNYIIDTYDKDDVTTAELYMMLNNLGINL